MSDTSEFRKNPQNYLKNHRLTMAELNKDLHDYRFIYNTESATQYYYKQLYGIDFAIAKGDATTLGVKKLEIVAAGSDTGVRFLPWKPNSVTYMKLDDAATWFFTGPIEGCFVYVARKPQGAIYVFHVNANAQNGTQNIQAKDNAVRTILAAKGLQIGQRLAYSDYNKPGFTNKGFVYGWKEAPNWRFHVHSLTLIGKQVGQYFDPKSFDKHISSTPLPSKTTL